MKRQLKAKTKLTPEDALNFLHSMIDLDNNTEAYKKRLIQRFVKKVVLYNDRNNTNLIVGNGCLVLQCTLS